MTKTALITGATSGFGKASVQRFVEAGWSGQPAYAPVSRLGSGFACPPQKRRSFINGWQD